MLMTVQMRVRQRSLYTCTLEQKLVQRSITSGHPVDAPSGRYGHLRSMNNIYHHVSQAEKHAQY